jgi:hypothetical protein
MQGFRSALVSTPDTYPAVFRSNPDPDPIRIQGFDEQKFEKNYNWEKIKYFFLSKIAIYLSLGLHKGHPSYRRRLQPSKENFFSIFVCYF